MNYLPPAANTTALIIDDSSFARRHTRALVESLGFKVTEASSGEIAVNHCRQHTPDIVLLDFVMAGMNGLETLIQLRRVTPHLKVIVVSADVQQATQKAAREAGAGAYITKPVTPLALSCALARVLHARIARLPPTLEEALVEMMTAGYARAGVALSTLTNDRVALDPAKLLFMPIGQVATQFAERLGPDVVAVHQIFEGPVGGNAMLLFDYHGAVLLTQLVDSVEVSKELNHARQDIITEVGNILLNACLGVFGHSLRVQVSFSVPRVQMADISTLFASVSNGNALNHAVVIESRFTLRASGVSGLFLLVLGIASLEAITSQLKTSPGKP